MYVFNEGESDIPFKWECESSDVKVDPPVGVLQGQLKVPFTIQYTPTTSGRFQQHLTLKTLYGSDFSLLCHGEAYGPKLTVERPLLDFGIVQVLWYFYHFLTFSSMNILKIILPF